MLTRRPLIALPLLGIPWATALRADEAAPTTTVPDSASAPDAAASAASGTGPADASRPADPSASDRSASTPGSAAAGYASRPDVQAWVAATAPRLSLDIDPMLSVLATAVFQPSVVRAIMPPPAGTAKNWAAYRARFTDSTRVRNGVDFMRQNAGWLTKAEAQHGVPGEVILGILGVETLYGRNKGSYRVLDALATLAFDFPAGRKDRSAFFRDELGELFVLARRLGVPVDSLRGSYAGAMGWPQFMPSSWNKYAVDADGDGRADLINSTADAIASVANYLARFGWVRGLPTHFSVDPPVDTAARATLLQPDILPTFTPQRMMELGAQLPDVVRHYPGELALIELQNGDAAPTYYAGTRNFYAITRYNWSSYYAMAVIELGQLVGAVGRRLR